MVASRGTPPISTEAPAGSCAKCPSTSAIRGFAIQVTDFELIDAGPRIPLTYDCVRNP